MSKDEDSNLLSKLSNLFKRNSEDKRSHYDESKTPANPINEVQILSAHTDIVRIVWKLDEIRIASASDDATINIWNYVTGEKLLTLLGHTKPITCLLSLDRNVLISGSSDRTIRMWDLTNGHCTRILTAHQGSIKALCMLPRGMFCSGANDRQLCVWDLDGELISTIERQEEEIAYHIDSQQQFRILVYHRESVQCLVRISDKFFASASLDGCLVVWHTDTFTPRVLSFPENYKSNDKVFIFSVHYLLPLGEGYLVVAIGKKVELYDIITGECILECENTHESNITCMISLYGGTKLLTSSADSSIKIWELPNLNQVNTNSSVVMSPKRQRKKKVNHPIKAVCAGDMWGHSDGVYCMTPLTDNSLASCGGDGSVVLWKDGQVQSDMRNNFATFSLLRHAVDELDDDVPDVYSPLTPSSPYVLEFSDAGSNDGAGWYDAPSGLEQEYDYSSDYETHYHYTTHNTPPQQTTTIPPSSSPARSSPSSSPLSSSGSMGSLLTSALKRNGNVNIPDYIFKHAEMLRVEKRLSLHAISEELRDQGHSDGLILAVTQKLVSLEENS